MHIVFRHDPALNAIAANELSMRPQYAIGPSGLHTLRVSLTRSQILRLRFSGMATKAL